MADGVNGRVNAEHALGDVRQRQIGDPADTRGDQAHRVGCRHLVQDVAVGEQDALGVAGGARGVQQGQRVIGLDRRHPGRDLTRPGGEPFPAQRREVSPRHIVITGRAGRWITDDDLGYPRQLLQDRLPAGQLGRPVQHRDPGIAVGGHIRDLLRRQRCVQRHPQAARVHRAEVGQDMLAAVREHQRHPLARRQPQRGEPGCGFQYLLPGLQPGQGLPAVTGPGHGLVGVRPGITGGLGDVPQLIAQGAARHHALDLSPPPDYVAAHGFLHIVARTARQPGPDTRPGTAGAATTAADMRLTPVCKRSGRPWQDPPGELEPGVPSQIGRS